MKLLPVLLCGCFLVLAPMTSGQYYNTGQDPGSLKWLQIKTGRFKIIFPESYTPGGADFAKALDEAYSKITSLYPSGRFRIPVIIHNYTVHSNGYVAWAPDRMEIYPTPEQNTVPVDPDKTAQLKLRHRDEGLRDSCRQNNSGRSLRRLR